MKRSLLLIALLGACARAGTAEPAPPPGATTPSAHGDEDPKHPALPNLVRLTPQVASAARIEVAPTAVRTLPRTVSLNGQIAPDPDHVAMLAARVAGRVEKVKVREGDAVKAGQAVLVLSSPELARQRAAFASAAAKASASRTNATRLRALVEQRLGSAHEADAAAAEATGAEAQRDAIARTLAAMGATRETAGDPAAVVLASPIAGDVIQRDAVVGQVVEPSHTLLTVADLARAFFQAQLFEKDLATVEPGAPAEVRLNGYPDIVYTAKVERIAAQVDPQTHTLAARIVLDAPDARIRLGLFGTAKISRAAPHALPHMVVPLSAVADLGPEKVVFVRQPDGDFAVHPVTIGDSASGWVEVLAGLEPGEPVVIRGVHTLKSAVLKATMQDED